MLSDLLSSRRIQAGLVFFVLVVGSSLLYSWRVQRTTDAELAQSDVLPQQRDTQDKTLITGDTVDTSTVNFEQTETPLDAEDTQPMDDDPTGLPSDDVDPVDLATAVLPEDFVSAEAPLEEVLVSPYGFGTYPEVPSGFPDHLQPVWTWSEAEKKKWDALRTLN